MLELFRDPRFLLMGVFLVATMVFLTYGVYQYATRRKTAVAERVQTYAGLEEEAAYAAEAELDKQSPVTRLINILLGQSYMERVSDSLARADLPMRPSEYILLRLVLAGVGFLVGFYILGDGLRGTVLAILGLFIPPVFVRVHQSRRRAKFTRQLADSLMLLTNSLRSGYSFVKGLELVAKEMDDPMSKELNRMLREVNLGATIEQAMLNLGRRVNSQDMDIVISAYLVQKDVGGNLTEIMEKVAETIRERLRIQGDIKVLTAQGRLSGLVVGMLPLALLLFIFLFSPGYYDVILGPPVYTQIGGLDITLGVIMGMLAFGLQILGAYLIFKIVSIKV
jgi:tight adherence protein B